MSHKLYLGKVLKDEWTLVYLLRQGKWEIERGKEGKEEGREVGGKEERRKGGNRKIL